MQTTYIIPPKDAETSQEEVRRIIISDMVKKRNSIVLGCNLPNWPFRFLWQPTQTGRNSNLKTTQGYWINKEKPEDSFENFLKKKKFSADEQVKEILVDATKLLREELRREAEERSSMIDAEEHFDVFISYASEDRQIATAIFEALKNMNVKAWFDDRGKGEITPSHPIGRKQKTTSNTLRALVRIKTWIIKLPLHTSNSLFVHQLI